MRAKCAGRAEDRHDGDADLDRKERRFSALEGLQTSTPGKDRHQGFLDGLIPLRPPSDLAEGLFNSTCRPESNGDTIACATEADQGNVIPMELMKRLLKQKGLHQAVMFHDVRWGAVHEGRFLWVLLNSGSCGAYAFNHDPGTLRGAHSYRQPSLYFPTPGGTFAGESLPGAMTWARAYIKEGVLWMDVGKGEVVKLPPAVRDAWWEGTTRQWPFMAADMGISQETLMAHYLSNHVAVAYGDVFEEMVALSLELGFKVRVLGKQAGAQRLDETMPFGGG